MTSQDMHLDESISRRRLLMLGGAALGIATISPLLAACGSDDEDEPESEPDPTATAPAASEEPTATSGAEEETPEPMATDEPDEPDDSGAKQGGTLVIGSIQEPDNLNPWLAAATVAIEVINMIYEPLTRVDPEGNHVAVLAEEVPSLENGGISEDLLTYTYRLQSNVTWHDGTPFTADDVLFTYEVIADPATNAVGRLNFEFIESVEAPDPQTIVFTLNEPNGVFLETWVVPLLPKHIFEGEDINTTEYNRSGIIGTGPYKFLEWSSGERVVVERNENYWRDGAYLDQIEYRVVPSSDSLLAMLEAGEVDMRFVMTAEHVPLVRDLSDYEVHATPAHSYFHFTINQTAPIVSDPLVRQALTYGIDKRTICETILKDLVGPHWSPVTQPSWAHVEPSDKMDFDIDQAGALLDQAGWTGEGTRQKDGEPLKIEVMSIAGDSEREQVIQLAQAMWREIGVDIEIAPVDLATFVSASAEGTYQLAYGFWAYGVDPSSYNGRWVTDSPSNFLKYSNPRVDEILTDALKTADRDTRMALYEEFQEIVIEEATNVWLYNRVFFDAVKKRVRGFVPNPGGATNTWNVHEWWLEG